MLKVITDADAQAVDIALALDVETLPFVNLKRHLPNVAAVYFLMHKNRILYIGASKDIKKRWQGHPRRYETDYPESRIAWLKTSVLMLDCVERAMIHEFHPPYNSAHTEPGRGTMQEFRPKRKRAAQRFYLERLRLECFAFERRSWIKARDEAIRNGTAVWVNVD